MSHLLPDMKPAHLSEEKATGIAAEKNVLDDRSKFPIKPHK